MTPGDACLRSLEAEAGAFLEGYGGDVVSGAVGKGWGSGGLSLFQVDVLELYDHGIPRTELETEDAF